jgi:tetratricopeptide (TPR) repeat protein
MRFELRASVTKVIFLSITCAVAAWAGPGFGLIKKTIRLEVRQPATVRLSHTTIAFKGSSTNREYAPVEGSLLATLETELVSNERTLVKKENPADAEWVLDLKVTGFSAPPAQSRSQTFGNSTTVTVSWTGSLNVAYQVLDHSGRVHDANNVSYNYNKSFGAGESAGSRSRFGLPVLGSKKTETEPTPHSEEDVKQILLHEVVHQIAANLGSTTHPVDVQVATGEDHMNHAETFMEQKLWQRAIDELQAATAFPKEEDESYRIYDLGLAMEALGYDSKTSTEQREDIFKAAEYYDKALEMNRKEKYFVETSARIKDSIARYKAFDSMQEEDRKRSAGEAPRQTKTLRASDVIDLFSSGVPEDQITDLIHASPVDYDYQDIPTMLAISKAKLPVPLQNELRKKTGAPLLSEPAKR